MVYNGLAMLLVLVISVICQILHFSCGAHPPPAYSLHPIWSVAKLSRSAMIGLPIFGLNYFPSPLCLS